MKISEAIRLRELAVRWKSSCFPGDQKEARIRQEMCKELALELEELVEELEEDGELPLKEEQRR